MKFSDVAQSEWESLRPYVDTCLLPVTGLTGSEAPWEATQALEHLRDALDCFEIPYKGRILTYPAFHFVSPEEDSSLLKQVCTRLKDNGFAFVVVVTAKAELGHSLNTVGADLSFALPPQVLNKSLLQVQQQISRKLQHMWSHRTQE
ncbi:DUF2487 family protein [Paenibacillus xerothermodurans]|uniref:DUF2487 family protein n=1 Tax=Paenibacillus xerothermodurans TaxID=1977292 RepID=A0A2W1NB52_PAEXE|nr:DUF2487 family protein [Paenibacillus xerothermodurans]PZE21929.1 DUF2487 family protein [Paenibacillus xerothermodurans]